MDEELKNTPIPTAKDEGIVPENQVVAPTEQAAPTNGWDEIISQYAPGTDVANPQAVLDAMLPTVQKMITMEGKIKDMIETSPELASFFSDLIDTGDLGVALNETFSEEEILGLIEHSKSSDYDENRKNYSDKIQSGKDQQIAMKGNQDISIAEISSFFEEKGWSEEKADEFSNKIDALVQDVLDGKITKEHLTVLDKGFNRDGDVATAEENGKIMGKNEKITSGKKGRADLKDLLPEGGGASISQQVKPKTYGSNFLDGVI